MATISVYNPETNTSYNISATMENSIVNGTGDGAQVHYMRLSTNQKDPLGQSIKDRIVEDIGVNDVTESIEDALASIIDEVGGGMLTSNTMSTSSQSTEAKTTSSTELLTTSSSVSSGSSKSSVNSSSSSASSESSGSSRGSSESTEVQGE